MSSTPERVYAWLKERAETTGDYQYTGEKLEQSLLSRESDLIDLGLARYGCSRAVVKNLFSGNPSREATAGMVGRCGHRKPDMAQVLRLAALSNRMLVRLGAKMPYHLFRDDSLEDLEPIREFVTSADPDEVFAMFQNPTIDGEVLAKLYSRERPFDSVNDDRWEFLIRATLANPRLQAAYVGPMDGWAEYKHGQVFEKAWALAEKVPITNRWANVLVQLLEVVSPEVYLIKDKMAVIQRWQVGSCTETVEQPDPSSDGFLDDFGTMRVILVRMLRNSEVERLKSHEDVALRCGFYRYGNPTQEDLIAGHAREPNLLLDHALWNDSVWSRKETRERLHTLCWAERDLDLSFPNAYQEQSDRFEAEHPEWFKEDPSEGEKREHQSDLVNGWKAIHAGQADILKGLADMRTRMTIVFSIACFVLAAILFRRL
jgi:hypothetical protein